MNYNRFTEFSETAMLILTNAKREFLRVNAELNEIETVFDEDVKDYAIEYQNYLDSVTLHVCVRDFLRNNNRLTDYDALKCFFKSRKAQIIYQYEKLIYELRNLIKFYCNYEVINRFEALSENNINDKIDSLDLRGHIKQFLKIETNVTDVYLVNQVY